MHGFGRRLVAKVAGRSFLSSLIHQATAASDLAKLRRCCLAAMQFIGVRFAIWICNSPEDEQRTAGGVNRSWANKSISPESGTNRYVKLVSCVALRALGML